MNRFTIQAYTVFSTLFIALFLFLPNILFNQTIAQDASNKGNTLFVQSRDVSNKNLKEIKKEVKEDVLKELEEELGLEGNTSPNTILISFLLAVIISLLIGSLGQRTLSQKIVELEDRLKKGQQNKTKMLPSPEPNRREIEQLKLALEKANYRIELLEQKLKNYNRLDEEERKGAASFSNLSTQISMVDVLIDLFEKNKQPGAPSIPIKVLAEKLVEQSIVKDVKEGERLIKKVHINNSEKVGIEIPRFKKDEFHFFVR